MMDYVPNAPLWRSLARLGRQELADRLGAIHTLSAVRGLRFLDDHGRPRTIDLASLPWVLTPAQVRFFRQVARLIIDALLRLPSLYAASAAVREVLPLEPDQAAWLGLARHPASRPLAVMGRLDSTAVYAHAGWRGTFQFLEPNAVGVGGVHYGPAGCSVILDVLEDVLERAYPAHRIVPTPDPRQLLHRELERVAGRRGRRLRRIALIENTDYTTGTDEFGSLARHFRRHGLDALVVDPRDVRAVAGHLTARGREIDLLYRDCELNEFLEMEASGHRLRGVRQAVREGRMVSGLLWELDHKSAWELFTDPVFARRFSRAQQRLFRRHLPWTRLVRDAAVSGPQGARVDLPAYIRRHRERLVLKPNTLYGGQGVVIGARATQAVWERTLGQALRGRTRYVVQERARVATERFPVLQDGRPQWVERSVVSGFFFNSWDVGLVGRFSLDPVVNVSRGGGLLAALMISDTSRG